MYNTPTILMDASPRHSRDTDSLKKRSSRIKNCKYHTPKKPLVLYDTIDRVRVGVLLHRME